MQKEYDLENMKEISAPYKNQSTKRVHINLSHEAIDYFKQLSIETAKAAH